MAMWAVTASGQIKLLDHPNHYIIVVDASFSTVENSTKSRVYHKLLHEELPNLLYSAGFGEIPRLMPAEDQVSLLNFGIVTDDRPSGEAYRALHQFSFQNQFIHQVFVRRTGVTQEVLNPELTPRHFFRLTVGSWARELAVRSLQLSASQAIAERTFLIFITDGELNGGSSRDEIATARQWGDHRDTEVVRSFLQGFAHDYVYLGHEVDGASFSTKYDASSGSQNQACVGDCFYLEAYEIVPAKWLEWQKRGDVIVPFGSLGVSYQQQSGSQSTVGIRAEQSPALRNWLEEAPNGEQRESLWAMEGDKASAVLGPEKSGLLVRLPAPLACGPRTFRLLAEGTIRQSDPLLGARTTQFTFAQSTDPDEPDSCRTAHFVKIAILYAAAAVVIAICGWYGYNRFWADHIRITLPGLLGPLALNRKGTHTVGLLVPPHMDVPALEVQLPSRWYQALFYSDAQLKISGETAGAPLWSHNQSMEFRLPYRSQSKGNLLEQNVTAIWRRLPSRQAALLLQIKSGRQTGTLKISLPHGWNSRHGVTHE